MCPTLLEDFLWIADFTAQLIFVLSHCPRLDVVYNYRRVVMKEEKIETKI